MNMRIPVILASCLLIAAGCASSPSDRAPDSDADRDASRLSADADLQGEPADVTAEDATGTESSNKDQIMPNRENLSFPGVLPAEETNKNVRIKTNKGDILFELLPDEGPNAASNFVYLVKNGYYDGIAFHRYVPNFVIQGGDPTGTGAGDPGYAFADDPVRSGNPYVEVRAGATVYLKGTVAMANAGPDTNGSQFFIMNADASMVAGPAYSVFGHVIQGIDVVERLRQGDVMESVTLEEKE
jgi:peptidyl-prolyl cis-trans isomerase B (cyclophilin B)